MARIIFISPYLKEGKDAARLAHRTKYVATREGVELLKSDTAEMPPTKKQTEFIGRLVRSFPEAKELLEYEDYKTRLSRKSAGELIEQVWEQYVTAQDQRENFLDYVAHRPGVKSDGDDGLGCERYVACCGTSSLPVLQTLNDKKNRPSSVYLCLDDDEAGHKASQRMAEQLKPWSVDVERLVSMKKDWNEDLKETNQEVVPLCQIIC